jgi:hypothetical protein
MRPPRYTSRAKKRANNSILPLRILRRIFGIVQLIHWLNGTTLLKITVFLEILTPRSLREDVRGET